ncbi:collagen alpha-1(xiv) chain [Plakobranchus ocellatus]|uniref:Collagen alpha-1(Xiv) chain n=1 Tax=Plakobranchus ocellatus TaxID=259542 RepID=A0AAV4DIW3_9GAST|nr:collagen alpha-1(xiv) chain [Plakobranchus ocellatus]
MNALVVFTVLIGLAVSAPSRDPFQNVPSPCVNNPSQRVYFPHPTDNTKFLQCDIYGRMYIIQCPQGEGGTPPVNPTSSLPGGLSNPCTPIALQNGVLFHPVPNDRTKFIQCDLWGQAFLMDCPNGFVWNATYKVCVNPNIAPGKK